MSKKNTVETEVAEYVSLDIPESWAACTLKDIARWGSGGTPSRGNSKFYGGDINWLKTGDLNDSVIFQVEEKITKAGLEEISGGVYPPGTLIMAMYGATIGKLGILDIPAATNQACACAQCYEGVQHYYLFYWLRSQRKSYIEMGRGGGQPNISRELIYKQPFALPPLAEQKRIVAKIEATTAKIEIIEKAADEAEKLLQKYRESILAKAFRGELVPQDPSEGTGHDLLARIRSESNEATTSRKKKASASQESADEVSLDIPESWANTTLGEFSNLQYGKNLPTSEFTETGYPVFGANGQIGYYSRYTWEDRKLLMTCRGATCGTINVSLPQSFITNNSIIISPKQFEHETLDFLRYQLISGNKEAVISGSAQPQVTIDKLQHHKIVLPPLAEQTRIVAAIEMHEAIAERLKAVIANLKAQAKKLRESILAAAFSGKLVPQDASEGTGHELLAQIRAATTTVSDSEDATDATPKKPRKKRAKK